MAVKITGIGIGLPAKIVTNDELSELVDTNDKWISTRTGIKERRVATTETLVDLAVSAGREAIENMQTTGDIDLVVCATLQGEYITPNLASMVQSQLGLTCPAFDINAACCGFLFALEIAKNFIKCGYKKILVICADMMSKHVDWTKRETCVLFGDAASACVIEKGTGLEYINLTTTGDDKLIRHEVGRGNNPFLEEKQEHEFLYLNGQEVYKFALGAVHREFEKCFKTLDFDAHKIDNFILHQANKRIIDAVRESLDLPEKKFPVNIEKYGNTSAASILILLYELQREGKIKKGDRLFMAAFGGGLASASCVMKWGT